MNRIKLCIFDMDGLLLDTERKVWFVGERKIAKECGKEMTDEIMIRNIGSNRETRDKLLKEEFGEDFPVNLFDTKLHEYFENTIKNEKIPLMPGVVELLEFLKENKIFISLGTSTEKKLADIALDKAGLSNYFEYAVYGDQVQNGKPNPEIYLKSVNHFNLKPEECIVFEDSLRGAEAAYNGNINLILIPNIEKPDKRNKEKALAIFNSLQEAIPLIKKINNIN